MDAYLNKAVGVDLSKIENVPYGQLEGLRDRLKECKDLFYDYYFTKENYAVGVNKYTPGEKKNVKSMISTMHGYHSNLLALAVRKESKFRFLVPLPAFPCCVI